jgi:hypothetical protein
MALSAIPDFPPERLEKLLEQILVYIFKTGTPPDHSVAAAKIESELGFTRDEMRAVHHHILVKGYVAERARMGHIGLSVPGKIAAQALLQGDHDI